MSTTTARLVRIAIAAVLLAQAGLASASQTPAEKLRDPSQVLVIAHRGCVGNAPEVSIASIHACDGMGIDGIELDIRKTRDGALIAMHDDTVDRTTNGSGKVADLTLEEIRRLRLRVGYGGRNVPVTDERVPTLEEMLEAARSKGHIVHLDIKAATHGEVADAVRNLGMAGQGIAWITGAPDDAGQIDPEIGDTLALIPRIQDCPEGSPADCRPNSLDDLMGFARFRPAGYFLWYLSTPEFYRRFNAARRPPGTRLATETLWITDNLPAPERHARYRALRDAGVTMFLTDRPAELAAFLRDYEGAGPAGPAIAAHRGGAMHRPENTMSAFRHAVELGVEVLEFDMVMTADDRLVVHHDATIDPGLCTPDAGADVRAGPVRGLTFAQTQQFDCGTLARDIYDVPGHVPVPGARMPSVDAVLGGFAQAGVTFYAETKVPRPAAGIADVDPRILAEKIDDLVRRHGVEDRFILQSSDYRTIDALHGINPRIRTCLLGAHDWGHRDFIGTLQKHHAACILLRDTAADRDEVRTLRDAGVLVYSEVIDTQDAWRRYVELGVDVIFTNDPGGAIDYLKRIGLRD